MTFVYTKNKNNSLTVKNFLQYTKLLHLLLRGKAGQLSEKKTVLYWSNYIITVVYASNP